MNGYAGRCIRPEGPDTMTKIRQQCVTGYNNFAAAFKQLKYVNLAPFTGLPRSPPRQLLDLIFAARKRSYCTKISVDQAVNNQICLSTSTPPTFMATTAACR